MAKADGKKQGAAVPAKAKTDGPEVQPFPGQEPEPQHEPIPNELLLGLERIAVWTQANIRLVLGVVAGVALLAIVVAYYNASQADYLAKAWKDFAAASNTDQLAKVVRDYDGTLAAAYAKSRLADIALIEGRGLLVSSRDAALRNLDDALAAYSSLAADLAMPPDLRRHAAYGRALALESSGKKDDRARARTYYEEIKSQYAGWREAEMAARRLERLDDPLADGFYQSLANYEPSAEPDAGLPPLPGANALPPLPPAAPPKPVDNRSIVPAMEFDLEKAVPLPPPAKPAPAADMPKADPARPAPKAEPPKAEPPKAEPPKAEPPKAEPPKAPAKAEPPKTDPAKPAPKAEPPKSDPVKPTPKAG